MYVWIPVLGGPGRLTSGREETTLCCRPRASKFFSHATFQALTLGEIEGSTRNQVFWVRLDLSFIFGFCFDALAAVFRALGAPVSDRLPHRGERLHALVQHPLLPRSEISWYAGARRES